MYNSAQDKAEKGREEEKEAIQLHHCNNNTNKKWKEFEKNDHLHKSS